MDDLKQSISEIERAYLDIDKEWKESFGQNINFGKCQVRDIKYGDPIYAYMASYTRFMNVKSPKILITERKNIVIRTRIKNQNSIDAKLERFLHSSRHEYGKISVNKCFCDLFGLRIIMPNAPTYEQVASVKSNWPSVFRCRDAPNGSYRATHLCFKADNYSFPWELQIWDIFDEKSNEESHSKYKQEYTSWEKESQEGGIVDGETLYPYE